MIAPQTGRIFISYRRVDSAGYAGRIYDRLAAHFGKDAIFMDVDTIEAGLDFVDVLENAVQSCEVLVTLIGKQWLNIADETGKRRLDNPEDFVRIEVAAALSRQIRVIPVLVDGVPMPNSDQLPDNLKLLARRNAVLVNHHSFHNDANHFIEQLELALKAAEESKTIKRKELKEKEIQEMRQAEIENLLSQADIALELQGWELAKEKLESVLALEIDHVQAQVKLDIVKSKLQEISEQYLADNRAVKEKAEQGKIEPAQLKKEGEDKRVKKIEKIESDEDLFDFDSAWIRVAKKFERKPSEENGKKTTEPKEKIAEGGLVKNIETKAKQPDKKKQCYQCFGKGYIDLGRHTTPCHVCNGKGHI